MPTSDETQAHRHVTAEPLTAEAFAPFGDVLEPPAGSGRAYFEAALENGRPAAWPSLSLSRASPADGPGVLARVMERHAHSSQSFVALEAGRWLVVVAPHGADGGPDVQHLRAFVARAGQGITYRADVWHHPLTVFDREAVFAVFMWRDGTAGDEEFVDIPHVRISLDEKEAAA